MSTPPYPDPCHSSRLLVMQPNRGLNDPLTTTSKAVRSPLCLMTQLSRAGTSQAISPHLPCQQPASGSMGDVTRWKTFIIGYLRDCGWRDWPGLAAGVSHRIPSRGICARWDRLSLPQCIVGSINDVFYPDLVCPPAVDGHWSHQVFSLHLSLYGGYSWGYSVRNRPALIWPITLRQGS